jgi:hypothetical protein
MSDFPRSICANVDCQEPIGWQGYYILTRISWCLTLKTLANVVTFSD